MVIESRVRSRTLSADFFRVFRVFRGSLILGYLDDPVMNQITRAFALVCFLTLVLPSAFAKEPRYLGKDLPQWLQDLHHNDAQVRRRAAFAIGKMGSIDERNLGGPSRPYQ